jgi:membrane protein required for colicin V production
MTAFDYTVLAIVGLSVLVSLFRGALRELMSIGSWIGAFLIAIHFAPMLSGVLPVAVVHPWLRLFLAFAVLMILSLLLFALITLALGRLIRGSGLAPWDRALGVLFGLFRALVILVALMLAAGLTPLPREPAWRNGLLRPPLEGLAKNARAFLPKTVAERIRFSPDRRAVRAGVSTILARSREAQA